jgi:hypothetical protein
MHTIGVVAATALVAIDFLPLASPAWAQEAAAVSLDEMEGDVAARWRDVDGSAAATLEPDEQLVKDGELSGRWDPGAGAKHIYLAASDMPTDWQAFGALELWVHSAAATGAVFAIIVQSENPDTEGEDYYRCLVPVDWEGWRFLHLEPRSFLAAREPLGWRHVDTFRLAIDGWSDLKHVPGTVLRFDALRLLQAQSDPERRLLFEPDTDWCAWWPLTYATAPTRTGRYVAEWLPDEDSPAVSNRSVPSDWSGSTHLNLWIHCQGTGDSVLSIRAVSDRQDTQDQDCYVAAIAADWEGWRLLSVPLADFERRGHPVGWEAVSELQLSLTAPNTIPGDARICLDDIWLSTRAETEATWAEEAGQATGDPGGAAAPSIAAPPGDVPDVLPDEPKEDEDIARLLDEALQAKKAGDLELAFTKYIAVLLRAPEHAGAHWGLAWVLALKGEKEAALEHFQKVAELSQDPERVKEAQAAIARLKAGTGK